MANTNMKLKLTELNLCKCGHLVVYEKKKKATWQLVQSLCASCQGVYAGEDFRGWNIHCRIRHQLGQDE